jgi:glycerate 2-kinase
MSRMPRRRRFASPVRALACPASLKGVLSATEAAAALAAGFRETGVEADECPIADGGEGTAEVLFAALGGDWHDAIVADPLGRPIRARWLALSDGTAVVESAEAIGLGVLDERDPLRFSSRGLGELIAAALKEGPRALIVCLGGTATVDGGSGLREVLSALPLPAFALCDVRSRLGDAARLYGPQKGASPDAVVQLEARLASMRELASFADLPGAGAAGGLGAALAALGAALVPGARYVLERIDFRASLRGVDVAVSGEGTLDATTREGKAPWEARRLAEEEGVTCALFGGRVLIEGPGFHELSGEPGRAAEDLRSLARSLVG